MFLLFLFLRNLYTIFHSGCIYLHSHQQCKSVPFSPHPFHHLLFVNFLMMTIFTGLRSSKVLPKAKLAPKRGHGHCLVICFPSDPLQLSESWINHYIWEVCKLIRCTKNCKACNQHWSTERAQFFSMTIPNCTLRNQCFTNWINWVMKFCLICHIHQTFC